jgi:hypothetical protein
MGEGMRRLLRRGDDVGVERSEEVKALWGPLFAILAAQLSQDRLPHLRQMTPKGFNLLRPSIPTSAKLNERACCVVGWWFEAWG